MDTSRPSRMRHLVLAWLCAAAALAYVHRNSIAVAEKTIRLDLGLTLDQMGWVMSGFFVAYALFQIPTGWLSDRWRTRRALALYSAVWSLATGMMALAGGFGALLVLRFAGGAAQAGVFPCAIRSISQWFPGTRRAFTSGLLGSFMSVGGAVGAFLTGILLGSVPWRWILLLYAVPGIFWSVCFYRSFRDRPEEHPRVNARELSLIRGLVLSSGDSSRQEPGPTPWNTLLTSPTMWCIGAQQFFRAAGYMFYASWFATFLQETRGVSTAQAGLLNSLPLWAVVVCSPVGGLVSDWVLVGTGSRRLARQGVAIVSLLACAALSILAYPIQNVWLAVLVITAGSSCAALGGPCAYAVTIDVGGKHVGTVFSTMNTCGNIGAAIFPVVVPALVKQAGSWDLVLFLFAGVHVAAAVCWSFVDPSRSIFDAPCRDAAK